MVFGGVDADAELVGDLFVAEAQEEASKHLHKAVANPWAPTAGYGPEYMWHVGRVHYDLLVPPK